MNYEELKVKIHQNAVDKGFWDKDLSDEHYLMLAITEVAEMVEADRKNKHADVEAFKRLKSADDIDFKQIFELYIKNSFEDEIADVVIRLLDLARARNIEWKSIPDFEKDYFEKKSITGNAYVLVSTLSYRRDNRLKDILVFSLNYIDCWAKYLNIDLEFFVTLKMKYNEGREKLHGKKY